MGDRYIGVVADEPAASPPVGELETPPKTGEFDEIDRLDPTCQSQLREGRTETALDPRFALQNTLYFTQHESSRGVGWWVVSAAANKSFQQGLQLRRSLWGRDTGRETIGISNGFYQRDKGQMQRTLVIHGSVPPSALVVERLSVLHASLVTKKEDRIPEQQVPGFQSRWKNLLKLGETRWPNSGDSKQVEEFRAEGKLWAGDLVTYIELW